MSCHLCHFQTGDNMWEIFYVLELAAKVLWPDSLLLHWSFGCTIDSYLSIFPALIQLSNFVKAYSMTP